MLKFTGRVIGVRQEHSISPEVTFSLSIGRAPGVACALMLRGGALEVTAQPESESAVPIALYDKTRERVNKDVVKWYGLQARSVWSHVYDSEHKHYVNEIATTGVEVSIEKARTLRDFVENVKAIAFDKDREADAGEVVLAIRDAFEAWEKERKW